MRPGSTYPAGARVWVVRDDAECPAVVLRTGDTAALVRYRLADGSGTGVDTIPLIFLRPGRTEHDPMVDDDAARGDDSG